MRKKIMLSFIIIFVLASIVSATEVKFLPTGNNTLLAYAENTDPKVINCNEESELNIDDRKADCSLTKSISEQSCQDRLNAKDQYYQNIKCENKTLIQNNTIIQIYNYTENTTGLINENKNLKNRNKALVGISFILSGVLLGILVVVFILFISRENKKKQTVIYTIIFLFALMPFARPETFSTGIGLNISNTTIYVITESENFSYPLSVPQFYPVHNINIERNTSTGCVMYNNSYNSNNYYNYTTCTQPVINVPACPEINYSRINVSCEKPDLSEVSAICSQAKQNSDRSMIQANNQTSQDEGEGMAAWVVVLIILGIVVFMAGIGIAIYFLTRKKKIKEV